MTDTDNLLTLLREAKGWRAEGWISQPDILRISHNRWNHGLTVHSRVADLRKRGVGVECKIERRNGRVISYYRLVTP